MHTIQTVDSQYTVAADGDCLVSPIHHMEPAPIADEKHHNHQVRANQPVSMNSAAPPLCSPAAAPWWTSSATSGTSIRVGSCPISITGAVESPSVRPGDLMVQLSRKPVENGTPSGIHH